MTAHSTEKWHDSEVTTSSEVGAPSRFAAPEAVDKTAIGVGFKHDHVDAILEDSGNIGFLEVHAENYMGEGGHPHRILERVRQDFPISLHGVCMSLGGSGKLDTDHLNRFAKLVKRYEPGLVSEHLAWATHDDVFYNDLLPLPYTETTLSRVCDHVSQMQDAIGRTICLENPATYVIFNDSTMSETDFLRAIVQRTGCQLLLDLNNVFISATNHNFSATRYLENFPLHAVGEIHLAGHTTQTDDQGAPLLIDSHNRPVAHDVWRLYKILLHSRGPAPTLVEWDSDLPEWSVLREEAAHAKKIQRQMQRMNRPMGNRHG